MLRLIAAALLLLPTLARAEVSELRITKQPGIIYLAPIVMEQQHLIEKAAASLGIPDLKTKWITFGGGGAAIDALLSGNVDIVTTGASNMLLAWDRTKGQVKGLAGSSSTPMWLISDNPDVKTLRDLKPTDKIAVPTVKISSQAIILQIAARQLYGDANFDHFDTMTMTLSHPDAQAQLTSGKGGGLTGHFSGAPYQAAEAKAPGLHVVTTSEDILGSRFSNAIYFAGTKFHDANPLVMKAFLQAAQAASQYIIDHPREACELYLSATGEKTPVDVLLAQIGDPARNFSIAPAGMMRIANHMADTKVLKTRPADWHAFFFPEAYALDGN
ncbi:MAG: ABC transporter substrate-binding protein [Acetobacteraceae bacterium]|nr:ABC transporter substrate-binding protein [Acetobacteraceae bacterium]